ncbi:hypothetical protein NAT51_08090 [Flavobacterium amniphilum]|uniref:hypothetical protein n=1 Tax=Flavobacterium amniphilum TaxID=1834035 RepID=UPI00202AA6BA|nr:hypothetical protein [Flavobacterium amniphilum]MCL9805478.1 hypothetical protein [Flavobacterium amniphilum]
MASGFITLPNGIKWSSRWTHYDYILETIMNQLNDTGDEGHMKKWFKFILPNEEEGDIECCWGFHKKEFDYELIVRIIDTRKMNPKFYDLFWSTIETLNQTLNPNDEGIGFLINDLYTDFKQNQLAENEEMKILEPEDDDIFSFGGFRIGR